MAIGTVLLGRCPPLLRDVLRQLLRPEFDVLEVAPAAAGPPSIGPTPDVVAYLEVGAPSDEMLARAATAGVPLVVVSHDGGRADCYRAGQRVRVIEDLSQADLRELLGP